MKYFIKFANTSAKLPPPPKKKTKKTGVAPGSILIYEISDYGLTVKVTCFCYQDLYSLIEIFLKIKNAILQKKNEKVCFL